ncbi:MAG: VirB8/TrbF family protein [Alphaproteobacteria bacterium]
MRFKLPKALRPGPKSPAKNERRKPGSADPEARADQGEIEEFGALSKEPLIQSDTADWRRVAILALSFGCIAVALNIAQVVFTMSVSNERTVVPFVVTVDSADNRVMKIRPIERDVSTLDMVLETLVCQYVVAYNEIRPDEGYMVGTWGGGGVVDIMSTREVFKSFQDNYKILEYYERNGFHRYIDLLGPPVLQANLDGRRYYRLDYRERVFAPRTDELVRSRARTANIAVVVGARTVLEGRQGYVNPIGMQVFSYTEGELTNPSVATSTGDAGEPIRCGRGLGEWKG